MAFHEKVFGLCDSGCKVPVYAQEKIDELLSELNETLTNSLYMTPLNYNADFQCNQRRQTQYTSAGGTVDCWKLLNNGVALTVEDDGIYIENRSSVETWLNQDFSLGENDYVCYVSCERISGTTYLSLGGELTQLTQGIKKVNSNNKALTGVGFKISPNSSIKLNFCRLYPSTFTGIGFKEDYASALNRCYEKLQIMSLVDYYSFGMVNVDTEKKAQIFRPLDFIKPMKETPKFRVLSGEFYYQISPGNIEKTTDTFLDVINNYSVKFGVNYSNNISLGEREFYCLGTVIELSLE